MKKFNIDLPFVFFLIALVLAMSLIFVFNRDMQLAVRIVALASVLYFAVAFFHHYEKGNLSWEIITEYILIFLICLVLVSDVLNIS